MAAYAGWEYALLRGLGAPATRQNLRALTAWQRAEGGGASFNPLNTTQHSSGARNYNGVGVKSYRSPGQGTRATVQTLLNGRYGQIVGLLKSGKASAEQIAQAVEQSPWGTGGGVLRALGGGPVPIPSVAPGAAGGGRTAAAAPGATVYSPGSARMVQTPADFRSVALAQMRASAAGEQMDPSQVQQQLLQAITKSRLSRHLVTQQPRAVSFPGAPGVAPGAPGQGQGKLGRISFAPGADRPGAHTQKEIIAFASRVSGVFGQPLRVGTGTNHSQMTVNGNQSQHWTGEAVDIPATGRKLLRMGQAALIAAGADPRWARKQTGGLFNIGGRQIIFRTTEGGNHWNHLHLGA